MTNSKQVIIGAAGVAVVGLAVGMYLYSKEQGEKQAGAALMAAPSLGVAKLSGSPDNYTKLAAEYASTSVGERAELLAASILFVQGKFADARTQFEKFSRTHPTSPSALDASLGMAACLDAEGKGADAASKYQDVIQRGGDQIPGVQAKVGLARIFESQSKLSEAFKLYQEVDSTPNPAAMPWRNAAGERIEQLISQHPELMPPPAPVPSEQVFKVTTPPAGSTDAPVVEKVPSPAPAPAPSAPKNP